MPSDGAKSKGSQPGAPAGSYTLSDFEQLSLYNGNLNFSLPLVMIGGRGGAKSSVNLTIDSMKWQMDYDVPTREDLNITWGAEYANYMLAPQSTLIRCWRQGNTDHCEEIESITAPSYIDLSIFSEYVGPSGIGGPTFDVYPIACGERKPGYGPGILQGQGASWGLNPSMTLTRLTFIAPDGTEYELRDTLTGGKPKTHAAGVQPDRGQTFISAGGEGLTFLADTPISDVVHADLGRCSYTFYPSGYLSFSDGIRYRINNGKVEYIQDANGNRISYLYDSSHRVTQITDQLGRQVFITYDLPASDITETYDDIKYKSDDNTWRHIKVYRTVLGNALRSGLTLSSIADLFDNMPGLSTDLYNPAGMATRVELPDTNSKYRLLYNAYGVLARIETPTGGAIEYDRERPDASGRMANEPIKERRVYDEGGASPATTPDQRQVYGWTKALDSSQRRVVDVAVESYAKTPLPTTGQMVEQLQSKELHGYFGWPDVNRKSFYGPWREGLEYKSEIYAPNNTVPLRRTVIDWEQPFPVSWINQSQPNQSPETSPTNNPRVKSVTAWIMDVSPNLVSKQVYGYDNSPAFRVFNNRTDVWEYNYGQVTSGGQVPSNLQLLRHTQTEYLITDASPDPSPSPSPSASPIEPFDPPCPTCGCPTCRFSGDGGTGPGVQDYLDRNLIRLPSEVRVYQGLDNNQEQLQERTEYVYDEVTPFSQGTNVTGWTDPGSTARGNATTTKRWINPADNAAFVKVLTKFDSLGNVIEVIDPNNKVTTISFNDCFGTPDGDARSCGSKQTYAFATSTTNALGQTAYTKYDYYSGTPVTTEDANGMKINTFYNDLLGRVTQIVSAIGTSLQKQTTFIYNEGTRTITTTSDLNSFGDNKLKSQTIHDGQGRTIKKYSYENGSDFITTEMAYDGLGRVIRATNPYRTTNDATYGEIKTRYDALSRVIEVKTSDNAVVSTSYTGTTTTITDQAGKQRKSVTDALGRRTSVYEGANNDYQTSYTYDALDNLLTVVQGQQTRTFEYDGLKRLTSATNPESGTISYRFDSGGNLLDKTGPRLLPGTSTHNKVSYSYDDLNRVTKRTYNDGTPDVHYFYDAQSLPSPAAGQPQPPQLPRGASIGKVLAITYGDTNSINGTYYGYDAAGNVNASAQVTGDRTFPVMEYGYNRAGNMTSQKYPSGRVVTMSYDDLGRVNSLSGQRAGEAPETYISLPEYTANAVTAALRLGNGLWERTSFNRRLQPTEIRLGTETNQTSALKLSYTYGMKVNGTLEASKNNGDIESHTINVPTINGIPGFTATQSYEYDALNRLEAAQETMAGASLPSWRQTYQYDRYGNRRFSYTDGATTTPTAPTTQQTALINPEIDPATNRLVGYVYDPAGNVTTDAAGRTFGYDAENRQVAYNGGASVNNGDTASYSYDGAGRRIKKQVGGSMASTIFIYNMEGQLVAEYTDSTEPRTTQTSYVTTDVLGSTRVVTGQDQSVKERYDFLPYGEEIGARWGRNGDQQYAIDGLRQKFTGKERDESGLDYFLARYYSSAHGRFTSADPINVTDERIDDPQRLNLYVYARNNPLLFVDPDGKDVWIWIDPQPAGTTQIRLISSDARAPATVEIPVYRMYVSDSNNGVGNNDSVYLVTRDAPYLVSRNDDGTYTVGNAAFEPRDGQNQVMVLREISESSGRNGYPENSQLPAFQVLNHDGTDGIPAVGVDSPWRQGQPRDVATTILIHVGGEYSRPNGDVYVTGSEGCISLANQNSGNQGIRNFHRDVMNRFRATGGQGKSRIYLRMGKRKFDDKWLVNSKGKRTQRRKKPKTPVLY